VALWQVLVDDAHHFISSMRPGHGEHRRMRLYNNVALGAEAAGDNNLAVFVERFADGVERFLHCRINKAAGIDDDQIGIFVARRNLVAFGAQLGQNALGVRRSLRAT
jgi:hypothetical protein